MLNPSIFRAYDIRGIYPDELNEETAYKIGCAFAVYLKEKQSEQSEKIVVGHDARISSPILKRAFTEGVINEGINVWDIGLVTVDMVCFASNYFHLPAAMITASHNPKDWNGFKLMKSDVEFFATEDLEAMINEKKEILSQKKGVVAKMDIKSDYLKHVLSFVDLGIIRPMRITIDIKSDAVGKIFKSILEKLPLEISAEHYHFGCAFDSDGDRISFTDENGDVVNPSIIGALMAKYFLKKEPYGKIVYSVIVGKIVSDVINIYGGEAIREKVGHTFIERRLKETGGILGIEASGHYYFKKNFYADSGIISFLVMLDILSGEKKSLSVLASEFSKYVSIPEMNFFTKSGSASGGKVVNPEELIKKIAQNFEGYDIDWLDGLTVRTSDFWLNLRPSNTEPLVRLNIEAKDELVLGRVKDDLMKLIEKEKTQ
ncbi:MAG: phosphomannomutase/phosphoglucomutase [Candidatus Azambacteria bacterium]|nr:phosphomannomutase/phosphoglucomutase [Candidatus Azambacteria bacterium]